LNLKKKLIVLDLDQTLFDIGGRHETKRITDTMRPGLYDFLRIIYNYYNIAIWSATAWTWLEIKLFEFGLVPNPNFRFIFALDRLSMFNVRSFKHNGSEFVHTIKPLSYLEKLTPIFGEKYTSC